jgi:hypothetical protein
MDKLDSLIKATSKLDIGESIFFIIKKNNDVKRYILSLNQFEQLYDEGIDADGQKLTTYKAFGRNAYSLRTIVLKRASSLPDDRVTLFQTGRFYRSWKVAVERDSFEITANFDVHGAGKIAENINIENILGLTDESHDKLIDKLRPIVVEYIREVLDV